MTKTNLLPDEIEVYHDKFGDLLAFKDFDLRVPGTRYVRADLVTRAAPAPYIVDDAGNISQIVPAVDTNYLLNLIRVYRAERYLVNKSMVGVNLTEDKILDMVEAALSKPAAPAVDAGDERLKKQIEYSSYLQQIIEALCHGHSIPEPKTTARYHYDMAVEARAHLESVRGKG